MVELDDAEQVLRRYRAARRASPELRHAVRERLASSLRAAEVPVSPKPARGRGLVIAAALLAAAGAVLVLSQPLGDAVELSRRDAHPQAEHAHRDTAVAGDARRSPVPPAELPAIPTTDAPAAEATPHAIAPTAIDARGRVRAQPESPRVTGTSTALAEELAGLEAIRRQLAAGDGAAALAAIARHRAAFPTGQLVPEREALTIEALCTSGDTAAAVRRARAFALAHPDSSALDQVPARCR
jgi:ribosomal protein L13E